MIQKLSTNGVGKDMTTVEWTTEPKINTEGYMLSDDTNEFAIKP